MPRVLIIEDHEGTRTTLAGLLRLEGFDSVTAETGERGVAIARHEPLDVVLVDLRLPDMSGLDVVRTLKADGLQAPMVIVTVFPDINTQVDAAAVGADGYVEGWLSTEELFEVVLQALGGHSFVRHPELAAGAAPSSGLLPPKSMRPLPSDRRLQLAVRAIDCESAQAWSLRALAAHVGLSESRLRHLFAATVRLPLSRFIRDRRLLKAGRLLVSTRLSFQTIASRLHLSSDLRRVRAAFKERFGMSPREYRGRFWRASRRHDTP